MTTVAMAARAALALFRPLGSTVCALADAEGRVLSSPFTARRALPPFDASAMDGFAVRAHDVAHASDDAPVTLRVIGASRAGHRFDGTVAAGCAVAISTGAAMPTGADAVVVREDTHRVDDHVAVRFAPRVGHHIRRTGSELSVGTEVLAAGSRLDGPALGLLASQNVASVEVGLRPRVTVLSLGDELVPLGTEPGPDHIVASNGLMIRALSHAAGATATEPALVPDDEDALLAALRHALATSDVVVTTGGASVGEHDGMRAAMDALGCIRTVDKVRMKPGKPVMAGSVDGVPLIALPGNPVAAFVGFQLFVRPGLARALGRTSVFPAVETHPLATLLRRSPGRPELLRGRVGPSGFVPASSQGSANLHALVDVNALAYVDGDVTDLAAGSPMRAVRLDLEPTAETLDLP